MTDLERDTCEACGTLVKIGDWPICPHPPGAERFAVEKTYPFTTKNFTGTPIEVTSKAHEKALMAQYNVVKRDDAAWIDKEFLGHDARTGQPVYHESSGVGNPGCWI